MVLLSTGMHEKALATLARPLESGQVKKNGKERHCLMQDYLKEMLNLIALHARGTGKASMRSPAALCYLPIGFKKGNLILP